MASPYRLTPQAEADVIDIWLYFAQDSQQSADKLVDRFTEVYELLVTQPGIGTNQDQYRRGLRSFPVGDYIIFYELLQGELLIYRVLHGARDLDKLL